MENQQQMPGQTPAPSKELSQPTVMAILAYIGILVVIPFLMAKENPFVKFHIKQGLVLLVIEVAMWLLGMIVWPLWMFINIVNLAVLVLAIMGIINAVKGQEKPL